MGTCICACGATNRLPKKVSGKVAKCKRCGEPLTFGGQPNCESSPSPDPTQSPLPQATQPVPEVIEFIVEDEAAEESAPLRTQGRERGYGRALLWAMLFPSSIHNLIAFLTIWLVLSFASVIHYPGTMFRLGVFLWFFWVVMSLWYAAFRINVIESSAVGGFHLPDVEVSRDALLDLLSPALRWFGSWVAVMIPALLYVTDRAYDGVNVVWNTWQALLNLPFGGGGGSQVDPVLVGLIVLGVFFWPIVVLVATIGGFGDLRHFERVFITLGRTAGPYLLTVSIVVVSYAVQFLVRIFLGAANTPAWGAAAPTPGIWLLQSVLATGIELYVSIVAAMAIGLYFRHFGHRFAWDWGQQD